jgi:predicted CXXCH cytochrome family protein
MTVRIVACTALLLLATMAYAGEHANPGECATCHPKARVLWAGGVHAKEGIPCVGCHEGNAETLDADAGHRAMRWFEEPTEIAAVCGGCHAEVSRMRPYNLAVDQLALYNESAHGKARLGGDPQAPVCTDCHQNHQVLAATDPASPAFPANLTLTCGGCHADEVLAGECDLDIEVVHSFTTSPHGQALLEQDSRTGPSCAICHDSHGAAVPRNADVDKICGGCHAETRERLRSGNHKGLLERGDLAGCASCHSVHAGQQAAPLSEICAGCHEQGSLQIALGSDLAKLLGDAKDELAKARQAVLRAQRIPLAVRDHEGTLSEGYDYMRAAGIQLHAFEREPIEDLTRAASSLARGVRREIDSELERKPAGLALMIIWFYTAITIGILAHYRRRALHRGSP